VLGGSGTEPRPRRRRGSRPRPAAGPNHDYRALPGLNGCRTGAGRVSDFRSAASVWHRCRNRGIGVTPMPRGSLNSCSVWRGLFTFVAGRLWLRRLGVSAQPVTDGRCCGRTVPDSPIAVRNLQTSSAAVLYARYTRSGVRRVRPRDRPEELVCGGGHFLGKHLGQGLGGRASDAQPSSERRPRT
jgi:hypothetical protein